MVGSAAGTAFAEDTAPKSPAAGTVKYYIVGAPGDGGKEFLFSIAAKTLGDGRRYREIFQLNKDRLQPDGGRLVDPAELRRGWILILPNDASGPNVLTGVPPDTRAKAAPPAASTRRSIFESGVWAPLLLVAVGSVIVVALWRPGGRRRDAAQSATGPPPPAQDVQVESTPAAPIAPLPATRPAVLSAVRQAAPPAAEVATPSATPTSSIDTVLHSASGDDVVTVRLLGSRRPEQGWMWRDRDSSAPATGTVIVLGHAAPGAFCVNIAQVPDVLSLTGAPAGRQRLAAALAQQLIHGGVAVAVVDGTFDAPPGAQMVDSLAQARNLGASTEPLVVFCAEAPQEMDGIRELTSRPYPHTVVVLLTASRRSRWNVSVESENHAGRPQRATRA